MENCMIGRLAFNRRPTARCGAFFSAQSTYFTTVPKPIHPMDLDPLYRDNGTSRISPGRAYGALIWQEARMGDIRDE